MKLLDATHERFMELAAKIASTASCKRSKCGSVIVAHGEVIGQGYNSPPGELESQRRCSVKKSAYHSKVTDKTCCVHAEQRAIMDALQKNPDKVNGSRLYFIRLDEHGTMSFAGKPYCTICSKMALDVGIKEFVLYHEEGITAYDAEEYNNFSYSFVG